MDKNIEKAIKERRVISVTDSCGTKSWRIYDNRKNANVGAQKAQERGYDVNYIVLKEGKECEVPIKSTASKLALASSQ